MTSITSTEAPGAMAPSGYAEFLTQLLSQRELFFTEVAERVGLRAKLGYALLTLIVFCGFYGAVAGAYAGSLQALSAAIKLPLLFLGTLAICFPGFFLIQVLVGSRLGLSQVLTLVLSALALSAVLLAAVVPVAVLPSHRRQLLLPHAAARRAGPGGGAGRHGGAARGARVRL